MYREQGAAGIQLGVDSGPYAAAPRSFARAALPEASARRLDAALSGASVFTPLLTGAVGRRSLVGRLAWPGALVALTLATWAPTERLALVAALAALLVPLSVVAARRVLGRRDRARDGAYVFVTDLVDVEGDRVTVTPMGRARSARIDRGRGPTCVVIRFDTGDRAFPVKDAAAADRALTNLEAARQTLVDLAITPDLAKADAVDPFFELRLDGAWPGAAPRFGARGLAAWGERVVGAVLAWTIAALLFGAHVLLADERAWVRTRSADDRPAYEAYLRRPYARHDAEAVSRLAALMRPPPPPPAASLPPPPPLEPEPVFRAHARDVELAPEERAARDTALERGFAELERRAANPERILRGFRKLEARLRLQGDGDVRVGFTRSLTPCLRTLWKHAVRDAVLDQREAVTRSALGRALAEVFPTEVFAVVPDDGRAAPVKLSIRASYACVPLEGAPTRVFDVTFEARLAIAGEEDLAFRLDMPHPDAPSAALRPKSLFAGSKGDEWEQKLGAMSARAYDRLYDELYGLFLKGDPRVPLHAAEDPRIE